MKDDAAGALHSGFHGGVHHGDWAGKDILGLWSSTEMGHIVSFKMVHR
jgi:hypothetical protein